MQSREIAATEWPAFLDQFSRAHQGQPAQVRTVEAAGREQPNAVDLPLIGITDDRPPGAAGDESIRIMLGAAGGRTHVDHAVDRPARIRMAEWNDGYSASLQIESADGRVTRLDVGPPEILLSPDVITDGIQL